MFESVRVQLERHEGDVARIHGLELEPLLRIRLEVGVGDEILDGVEDFLEHRPLGESRDGATDAISKSIARDGPRVRMPRRARADGRQRRETRDETSDATHTQNKN